MNPTFVKIRNYTDEDVKKFVCDLELNPIESMLNTQTTADPNANYNV